MQAERRSRLETLLPRLRAALLNPEAQPVIERALKAVNGMKGDPKSFDALDVYLREWQPCITAVEQSGEDSFSDFVG